VVITPRLVISGPASGCGKTTVATGLMAALRARGVVVSGHKTGPDYIDPGYHALATGRPGRNLDPFLCDAELIGPLFARGAAGADVAVIEGAMGLFDGIADPAAAGPGAGPDFASTAHVARLLRAPVVLVVDAAAAGRSVAALVAGFAAFDPRVRVRGVILNRVGSPRHERLLTDAIEPLGIAVFGAIRRTEDVATPSRHLGLVPAAERRSAAQRAIARLGDLIGSSCDVDGLRALAATAPPLPSYPWDPHAALADALARARGPRPDAGPPAPANPANPVIAVAQGPAFTFSYTEHAELLEAAGAQVVPFDPLGAEALPGRTAGLVIGGGFPEMYAPQLSGNTALRRQVAALAATGAPVIAECAGLLYLARSLDGRPMCGVVDADTHMTDRLTLGYRTGAAATDSVLATAGSPVRGHEFHRTAVTPEHGRLPAWQLAAGSAGEGQRSEGHVVGNVVASYLHLHWAGAPSLALRFVSACRANAAPGGSPGPARRGAAL
jgi:cobyrinic acid a,c-diamide synthase